MRKGAAIMLGALIATHLAVAVPARADVVYVDPAAAGWQSDDAAQAHARQADPNSVWGGMEQAARDAAAQTGMAGRMPTPRANDAIFAQALAVHLNTPEGASVERLLDFRIPAASGNAANNDAPAAQPHRRSLIDLLLGSDVPEPGTWLYLILGFGLIGAMLRRRSYRAQLTAG